MAWGSSNPSSKQQSHGNCFEEKVLASGNVLLTEQDQPVQETYDLGSNSESEYDNNCFSDEFFSSLPGPYDEDSDYVSFQEPESQNELWQQGASSHSTTSSIKNDAIPPPPFNTPPKLKSVEYVMNSNPGTDLASLRKLTTALAREAIFGRDDMITKSIAGRHKTEKLDQEKLDYIKTLVHSRVPHQRSTEFEGTWKWCKQSLSKSCQTLRTGAKKKL